MVTLWLAFLQLRANKLVGASFYLGGRSIADFTTRFWTIVEALLAFGADHDVFFDFSVFSPEIPRETPRPSAFGLDEPDDLVLVSLLDLVLVDRPPEPRGYFGPNITSTRKLALGKHAACSRGASTVGWSSIWRTEAQACSEKVKCG